MTYSSPRIGLAVAAALIMPSMIIRWLLPQGRLSLGLGVAPFGWQILMIVQLVASIPIGLITSAGLVRSIESRSRSILIIACIMAGLALSLAVVSWGDVAARALASWDAGFLTRCLVRTTIAYLLVLPWLIVVLLRSGSDPRIPVSPASILVGATIAFLPPSVYANQMIESRSIDLKSSLSTGRWLKAKAMLVGLRELGGREPAGGTPRTRILRAIELTLARIDRQVLEPLPSWAGPSARLERAFLLIQLERLDEAESILRTFPDDFPDALLLLGAIYRDQARWSDSERVYRRVLDLLHPGSVRDRATEERCSTAYEGLAEAARAGGRPEVAERAYLEARRRLPARAGHFTYQLGRHYFNGGRPSDAINQLRQAVRLDPTLEALVRPLILQARVKTPACLLRSPSR